MSGKKNLIIVIGAGAAGLVAAGHAAELGGNVLVVEKMKYPGRKLLISGKGRCNVSNAGEQDEYFRNIFPRGKFLKHAFGAFFNNEIVKLLNEQGIPTLVERGNRIFPVSGKSLDVLNALLNWIGKYPVKILYETKAIQLVVADNKIKGVKIQFSGKKKVYECNKVILCAGGMSYPATGSTGDGYTFARSLGHSIEKLRPALVPLTTSGKLASRLKGLKLKNINAVLWVNGKKAAEEFGEAYIEDFGLDGPVILTLSRMVVDELAKNNRVEISIDLKPALNEEKLDARMIRDIESNPKKHVDTLMREWMPIVMVPVFLHILNINGQKEAHLLNSKERRSIMLFLKNLKFEINGHQGFEEAIITAGGIITEEINGRTMESKLIKNLYFAGEVIDLDANTGGYNLQIAFSTAWLAAESCMKL
jgi:predicted Rossmann fold flavoprotein